MNTTTKCLINVTIGEKLLFAKTDEETAELTAQQETHYLTCDNAICIGNMEYLKKAGLFQVSKETADRILGNKDENGNDDD